MRKYSSLVTAITLILALLVVGLSCTNTTAENGNNSGDTIENSDSSSDNSEDGESTFDSIPPSISNITVTGLTDTTAIVSWETDEPSTSQVEYGETTDYGTITALDENLVTSHTMNLIELKPETTYHYSIQTKDSSDNLTVSIDYTLTTTKPITHVSGLISSDTTWASDYIYVITGDTGVEQGVTLTIEPGTQVKFDGLYYLKVMGTLKAIGNSENKIYFTSNQDSASSRDWNNIRFASESTDALLDVDNNYLDGSTIQFAVIEYGGDPVIDIDGASPLIYECTVRNSGSIYIQSENYPDYANPVINQCTFSNNNLGGNYLAIKTWLFANPIIVNNTINGCIHTVATGGTIEYNYIVSEGDALMVDVSATGKSPSIQFNTIVGGIVISTSTGLGEFSYNNISKGNSQYALCNEPGLSAASDINVSNNWWGTTETTIIDELIYDYYDNWDMGKVIYEPIATTPISEAP